jgi:hypothetical protein
MKDDTQQTKDIRDTVESLLDVGAFTSKKDNAISAYVLEKVYRMTGALLSVSSLIHNSPEIRHALEQTALGLVKVASDTPTNRDARKTLLTFLRTTHGTLSALSLSGVMSDETASILIDELVQLGNLMQETGWLQAHSALALPLLRTDTDQEMFIPIARPEPYQTSKAQAQSGARHGSAGTTPHTSRAYERTPASLKDNTARQYGEHVHDVQKDRRATILGILQRKDRINIKDVSAVIKDCSEKTIQRELLALVAQGVLVKEGERRWSTYRLA